MLFTKSTLIALGFSLFAMSAQAAPVSLYSAAGYSEPQGCDVISLPQPRFIVAPKSGTSFLLGRSVVKIASGATGVIAGTKYNLLNSYWQAEGDDETGLSFNCATRQYLIFDVFVANRVSAVARIAVSADDLGALLNQPVYKAEDAKSLIAGQTANSIGVLHVAVALPKPTPTATPKPTATPAPKPSPTATPKAVPTPPPRPPNLTHPTAEVVATPSPSPKPNPQSNTIDAGTVVCVIGSAPVYDDSLNKVIFRANDLEATKLYQDFDGKPTRKITPEGAIMVKLQFPNEKSPNVGWIEEAMLNSRSDCKYQPDPAPSVPADFPNATADNDKPSACCNFPMQARPAESYLDGARKFGASRDGGKRIHAACDLYRPNGEDVKAVAEGTVIRGKHYFYQGVYEIEVRHTGGFIGRYGEVLGRTPDGVTEGSKITMGQTVGFVGTVNSGCCSPMMHFELYSGKLNGPLTQGPRGGYQRRADLVNPTKYLQKWEFSKFGAYYDK